MPQCRQSIRQLFPSYQDPPAQRHKINAAPQKQPQDQIDPDHAAPGLQSVPEEDPRPHRPITQIQRRPQPRQPQTAPQQAEKVIQ